MKRDKGFRLIYLSSIHFSLTYINYLYSTNSKQQLHQGALRCKVKILQKIPMGKHLETARRKNSI